MQIRAGKDVFLPPPFLHLQLSLPLSSLMTRRPPSGKATLGPGRPRKVQSSQAGSPANARSIQCCSSNLEAKKWLRKDEWVTISNLYSWILFPALPKATTGSGEAAGCTGAAVSGLLPPPGGLLRPRITSRTRHHASLWWFLTQLRVRCVQWLWLVALSVMSPAGGRLGLWPRSADAVGVPIEGLVPQEGRVGLRGSRG